MGLNFLGSSSSLDYPDTNGEVCKLRKKVEVLEKLAGGTLPLPDARNYEVLDYVEEGDYLVVKIHYPECTNYEGRKILVYRGVTLDRLVNDQRAIDPHFSGNKNYHSPIARFVPTIEGWNMAVEFVTQQLLIDRVSRFKRNFRGPND